MPLLGRRIRVLVVEDEPLYRGLLTTALSQDPLLEVVGSFADGRSAVAAAPTLGAHVALLDLDLGGEPDGMRTGLLLRRILAEVGVVLLSHLAAPRLLTALPPEHAWGWSYLLKRSVADVATLRCAVRRAAAGEVMVDPALVARRVAHSTGVLGRLTERQRTLVELLAQGWDNEAIALRLSLAPKTVDNQLSQIYLALGLGRAAAGLNPRVRTVLLYLEETYVDSAEAAVGEPLLHVVGGS